MTTLEQALVLLHFGSARAAEALRALPEHEQRMVAAVDPRAFRVDSERRARAVTTAVEELPVSAAVAGVPRLFGFFDDDAFLSVIHGRENLVCAVAAWLVPWAGDVALLEGAAARARRHRDAPRGSGLVLGVGVGLASCADGTLAFLAEQRARLGAVPHQAVAAGLRAPVPPPSTDREHVLVHGAELSHVGEALFAVLELCAEPTPEPDVVRAFCEQGATPDEARELVNDLLRDGVLQRAP